MRRMCQVSRTLSVFTTSFMFAAMVAVTAIFVNTESESIDGRPIWPRDPKEWPTYLLLAAALVSTLTDIIIILMFSYCYERVSGSWKIALLLQTVDVLFWVVVAVAYRKEKRLADLWGWCCSEAVHELQQDGGSVHFDKLCTLQTVSWGLSIAETIMKVMVLPYTVWLLKRLRKETHQSKIKMIETVGS